MSLTSALDTAKSSLIASQTQTALVSRNIANLNDPGATRKYAVAVTGIGGRVQVANVAQSQNALLYRNMLDSTAAVSSSTVVADGYQRINEIIGDTELGLSPAARIADLTDALHAYSSNPGSFEFARAALDASRDLANGLSNLAESVNGVRRDADQQLVLAADSMNELLKEIESLNDKVVSGTIAGTDVTDFVDKRDAAVAKLSQHVGVQARIRGNNDLVLHTDSGVNLFDKMARTVEFTPSNPLLPGQPGSAMRIDGVVVTGAGSPMPLRSGAVLGLITLRDEVAVTFSNQLDTIAGALVSSFQETGADGVLRNGLFDLRGNLAPGTPGSAAALRVHEKAAADPTLILNGGISADRAAIAFGTDAQANTSGYVLAMASALEGNRTFPAGTGIEATGTLQSFAASSLGWLQAGRAAALGETEYRTALLERTQETLSNETGVNLAQEMTLLTDLQRSYQASAKLISAVDEMLTTLLRVA